MDKIPIDPFTLLEQELQTKKILHASFDKGYLRDTHVIGFDLDHTLCLYNMEAMAELLYNICALFLIEHKGYPEILKINHSEEENENDPINKINKANAYKLFGTELVIDKINGNILQLDENKKVVKAFHGLNKLTLEEIKQCYGNNRTFHGFEFEKAHTEEYFHVMTPFEFEIPAVYALCVHLYDEGKLPKEVDSYVRIQHDIADAIKFSFSLYDHEKHEIKDMYTSGYYFPELVSNPTKYLVGYNPSKLFLKLKENNIKTFVATNSYAQYSEFLLKHIFGENFLDYIDMIVYFARKPEFFDEVKMNSGFFMEMDQRTRIGLKGNEFSVNDVLNDAVYERLQKEKIMLEGNHVILENYFRRQIGVENLNCYYCGDNVLNDCYIVSKLPNWKSIAISFYIETGKVYKIPPGYHLNWEDYFTVVDPEDNEQKMTFISKILKDHIYLTIYSVDSLNYFL